MQYCQRKDFKKGTKPITVSGVKTTSKKIAELSAKKTYHVRVRTYRKVGSKTYYSSWSAAKHAKTK